MYMRWQTASKYYAATIQQDLFGDLVVFKHWGSRHNSRGGKRLVQVENYEEAERLLSLIHKQRLKRGYQVSEEGGLA